ncbi:MAG: hypothetical protein M1300_06095 [Epsilonproteobacteria bacterium]|nr:hypothetical protein [Campylobacterota bacterium]
MNPFVFIQQHYIVEYAIVFALSALFIVMIAALGWIFYAAIIQDLFKSRSKGASCTPSSLQEVPNETILEAIAGEVEKRIRTLEFDSAIILMEKQRLKKLEIEELKLKHSLETQESLAHTL